MKPIFTVITVHFNQLPLLKTTVENIVSQKGFGDIIEYIIVDGLSTDGTINYLQELQVEKSIHRIVARDKGIYDAMNKGIEIASGEYIVFINAGDQLFESDTLWNIHLKNLSFDVLYSDTEIQYENFSRIAETKPLHKFWQSLPFVHQSVLVKRGLLLKKPFDIHYKFCADYNQLYHLYLEEVKFLKSDVIISRITAGGTSDVKSVDATKEVFEISNKLCRLKLKQKIYFKRKLIKQRLAKIAKKTLSKKAVNKITKHKYK